METTFKQHTWPGLATPVYLPDWITVEVKLIPDSVAGWTSGTPSTRQTKTTWHDTGNEATGATGEYNWAARGGRAEIKSAGSYNGIYDSTRLIIAQRFDQMVGHAYNPEGNYTSYAFEQAFGTAGGGFDGSWKVGCWVHAAVIVAKGWQVDTSLVKHQYWRRPDGTYKWCPGQILNRNLWSATVAQVSQNATLIRAYLAGIGAGGQVPVPTPVYAIPSVIPELDAISKSNTIAPFFVEGGGAKWTWVGDRAQVVATTGRYQRADINAPRVGPDLKKGDEFDLDWVTTYNGEDWGYTPYGTRIRMKDVTRISDTKGAQAA